MNSTENKLFRAIPVRNYEARHKGFSLIEVLVTIIILLIGLLGLAGLQGRAFTAQLESYQRAQALVLLKDMAGRIEANRKNASAYINNNPLGTGGACPAGATVAAKDLCAWNTALQGAAEVQGGNQVGAMIGARGCIFQETAPNVGVASTYQIVVAWQGLSGTVAPDTTNPYSPGQCGLGQYKDSGGAVKETWHRAIAVPVSVADLN